MLKIGYNAVENYVYSAKSRIGRIFSSPKSHAITDLYCKKFVHKLCARERKSELATELVA